MLKVKVPYGVIMNEEAMLVAGEMLPLLEGGRKKLTGGGELWV